jgi:uncharacterized membrane protein
MRSSGDRMLTGIIVFTLAAIAFSAFLRFHDLGCKLLWFDEETTIMHIASISEEDADRSFAGKAMPARDWPKLEQIGKSAPLSEVLHNLKVKKIPDQAPLFYLFARCWAQKFGNDPATIRCLSAIFSLLALPLVFILAIEMFNSVPTAWLSMALTACSPFMMNYAREARPYSLWLCATLVSSIFLCRAHKRGRLKDWLLFGATSALSISTHYAAVWSQIASSAVLLFSPRRKVKMGVLIASLAASALLLPWLLYAGLGFTKVELHPWLMSEMRKDYAWMCFWNATMVLFDFNSQWYDLTRVLRWLVFLLESVAMVYAYRRATAEGRLILRSAVLFLVLFGLPDLILGGRRLTIMRYLTPAVEIVPICVAAFLFSLLKSRPRLGASVLCLIAAIGLTSCFFIATQKEWWINVPGEHRHATPLLNARKHALWIGPHLYETLVMSRFLDDKVRLEYVTHGPIYVPKDCDGVFVCDPYNRILPSIRKEGRWAVKPVSAVPDVYEFVAR